MTAVDGFTPLIGGIPIMVDGQVVGGIGVSGAASAAQDDGTGHRRRECNQRPRSEIDVSPAANIDPGYGGHLH